MVAFGRASRCGSGSTVVNGGNIEVSGAFMQVPAHGVDPVVAGQPFGDGVQCTKTGKRSVHLAEGDGTAERRGWVVGECEKLVVPPEDLGPVGFGRGCGVVVQRRNRSLDLILATAIARECRLQDANSFADLGGFPTAAILLSEWDECP
jgi:hypothetical protein